MDRRYEPISPPVEQGARGEGLPAYVSNGLIGLRVRENPLDAGMCMLSGFVGEHHEHRVEAAVAAPYPLAGDLALNGLWASDRTGTIKAVDQAYDFGTAELTSRLTVMIGDVTADVEIVTFASRTHPTVVCQQVCVSVSAACEIGIRLDTGFDGVRGRPLERRLDTPGEVKPVCDGSLLWEAEGGLGRCGIALLTEAPEEATSSQTSSDEGGPIGTTYSLKARKSRRYRFTQIASLVPDVLHRQPQRQAVRLVAAAGELGFGELRRRNRAEWRNLWRSRIRLVGADRKWQAMVDAAFFYLNTSVHSGSPSSTSIYGLAGWWDYHYYYGHVMWDVDAFAAPVLTLLQPQAALAMLEFRSRGLAAARDNAKMQGRLGLQFPWEASPNAGQEATPGGASAAAREDHISLHVARAFSLYADATGDAQFLKEEAWPVLSGVADWFADRVENEGDGFALRGGGGPAERTGKDDNDAMTLMAARVILERACEAADSLGLPARDNWAKVARGLRLPMRGDGVIASHDGYQISEEKGATPSPLMGFFPYWADVEDETAARTLRFYLDLWPNYVGSPMLPALYATWAAWTGDRALSLQLLDEGYGQYQFGRFQQILEYRLDKVAEGGVASGPFFANMGGFLSGLMMGMPGLRISSNDPATWPVRPVVLPSGWVAIECDRLWVRGKPMRLRAEDGASRAVLSVAK